MAICFKNNKIKARTTLAYYDGQDIKYFHGEVNGIISLEPKGTNGFAWDSIFIPVGHDKTFAEMDAEEKNRISMRKIALEKLKTVFSKQYSANC